MKTFMRNRLLLPLGGIFLLNLFALAAVEGATTYSVDLKGPIPLVVGKSCPIMGTLKMNGLPAPNTSFGVEDGVAQRSFAAYTNSLGKFSFNSTPVRAGSAQIKFLLGTGGAQSIVRCVTVFSSANALFKSTSTPAPYLDYYRLNVCNQSNPSVTCKTVSGAVYCGIGTSTMSYCGSNSHLPNGTTTTGSYTSLSNSTVSLRSDQCFSKCYVQNYMQSVESASACAEAYCSAYCAYQEKNYARGFFWHILWNLQCNIPTG